MTGLYKIGTLAKRTGFSPAVLRAWERRFGLLRPERGPGGHRLYTDDDVRVLTRVRVLVDEGCSIGEIAGPGRDALLGQTTAADVWSSVRPGLVTPPARTDRWRQRIIGAALALDAREVSATVDEVFAAMAPEDALTQVIEPVVVDVGRLWETGTCSVASEHLVSEQVLHRVRRLLDAAQPSDMGAPTVVAACFPGEQHQLGLAILSWRIARQGIRVAYFGPALPLEDLSSALPRSRFRAVLLSVTRRATFKAHYPTVLELLSNGPRVFIGGQGVPPRRQSASTRGPVVCVGDLSDADTIDRIVAEARDLRTRRSGKRRTA